jgi:hypothetical protein
MIEQHYAARDQVLATFERAIALTQTAGDRVYEASAMGNYGPRSGARPFRCGVVAPMPRSVEIHRELGNARSASIMLGNLGSTIWTRDISSAHGFRLGHGARGAPATRRRLHEGVTLGHLALHALVTGDWSFGARPGGGRRAHPFVRGRARVSRATRSCSSARLRGSSAIGTRPARGGASEGRVGEPAESLATLYLLDLVPPNRRRRDGHAAERVVSELWDASSNNGPGARFARARLLFVADALRTGDAGAGARAATCWISSPNGAG